MFADYAALSVPEIYDLFRDTALGVGLNPRLEFREQALVPVDGHQAQLGAALFLAILAYPDDDAKQYKVVTALAAQDTKTRYQPKHPFRRELRQDQNTAVLLDIPNRDIQGTLADVRKRLNKRFRASWVLLQKFASNPDPNHQDSLQKWMLTAARQNTHDYLAFGSSLRDPVDRDDAIMDSFRHQVMAESRPVAHAAMAFYLWAESRIEKEIGLTELVMNASNWLKPIIVVAEIFRLSFGSMFPRHDTPLSAGRVQNFAAPLRDTIAIHPYPLPIAEGTNFRAIFQRWREQSRRS